MSGPSPARPAPDGYIAGGPPLRGSDRLVVVSGCSGAGKSSLLREMEKRGFEVMQEPGRQVVKEQLSIDGDGVPWKDARKFAELCISRAMYFYNTARPGEKATLFDRSLIDNIAGLERMGFPMPDSHRLAVSRYRYARTVFVTPPWRELFVNDAERQHSFADAEAEYEGLVPSYRAAGYDIVVIPRLPLAERADFLEEHIAAMGRGK